MDKVIILKCASNRGKTQTLLHLITHLKENNKAISVIDDAVDSIIDSDCFVILDIPNFGNVGIITFGDKGCESMVAEALKKCLEKNCTALVAASHTQYKISQDIDSVYKMLWDFGHDNGSITVETTTIVRYNGWGQDIEDNKLNEICAVNLSYLLFNL